jgi:hypothetical protein
MKDQGWNKDAWQNGNAADEIQFFYVLVSNH